MTSLETFEHSSDPAALTEMYRKLLVANGILDPVSKVTSEDPGLRGEGAGSERRYVTVEFENPKLKPLQLFAKLPVKGNPDHMELTNGMKSFEKEGLFLTKYVDAAKELCRRKGFDETLVTDIYPKCYYGNETAIIMENLKVDKNYAILGKDEPHGWDTTTFALKTLAQQHAISHALIQEAGGAENFLQRFPVLKHDGVNTPVWTEKLEPWFQSNMNTNIKVLELNSHLEGSAEALSCLKQLKQKKSSLAALCWTSLQIEDSDFLLLNHGDYWYGNMLFLKDPPTGKLIGEKAVDFQAVRYNSPAVDVSYYLFTSTNTELRLNRLQELLQFYLTTLQKLAADLGHPIDLSVESLYAQYRKKLHLGLIMSFMGRYGPGGAIMASSDITKVTGDWGEFIDKLAKEWVAKNAEQGEKMAQEIISVTKEYTRLILW